ncbi:hypothetical protein EOI86_14530 [Hwanghaeella grinnelliae]|uniref:HTH crp-type domain-containing protein n=1 Tax=Hwanghaeella grinnelliae TaxID=2500179 RepID=A0A3S2VPJ9_9PROT|nr:helix-turn-helix domain-containing protein [Hwanghaeella grinnelliae]RVU36417.1 hypothetical protein EOI86_14530 [Hwanghaeella grinnelliae]
MNKISQENPIQVVEASVGPCLTSCQCLFARHIGPQVIHRRYKRGDRLPLDTSTETRIRVIRSGMVATSATLADGRRQLLCLRMPGDAMRPAKSVAPEIWDEALTETDVCEGTFAENREALYADGEKFRAFFDLTEAEMESGLAHRLLLGRFNARERLCTFLSAMVNRAKRFRGITDETVAVALPLSREDIADFLCLNAATVTREIKKLKAENIVRFPTPTVCEVLNTRKLEELTPLALKLCGQPKAT